MKRLVYSPKAYVYIKDSSGTIHDVSKYVVSGSINRKINQVSTATIELRNPDRIFTNPISATGVAFHPMDPITIYLQRLKDHPVRVFTGYLDKTPYYQMYPGSIKIEASCTLKRLLYTFFDPALPYTQAFLGAHGWVNAGGNSWINFDALNDSTGTTSLNSRSANRDSSDPDAVTNTIPNSKKVLVIGDSLAVGTRPYLKQQLGRYQISDGEPDEGEHVSTGVANLRKIAQSAGDGLAGTIIVSLGTNDYGMDANTFRDYVEDVIQTVGPKRHIIWFNMKTVSPNAHDYSAMNSVLADKANKHSNFTVLDWAGSGVSLPGEGIHPSGNGYATRAKMMADAVKGGGDIVVKSDIDDSGQPIDAAGQVQDVSSIGELLFDTLTEIGHWDENRIWIEALPKDLAGRMAALYQAIADDEAEVQHEFTQLMKNIIGTGSSGDSSYSANSSSTDSVSSTGEVHNEKKIVQTMYQAANRHNIPPEMEIATWLIEWPRLADSPGNPHYGYFQWDSKSGPAGSYQYGGVTQSKKDGCYDLGFASDCYAQAAAGYAAKRPELRNSTLNWTMAVQGVNGSDNPLYPQTWSAKIQQARNLISKYVTSSSASDNSTGTTTRSQTKGGSNKTTNNSKYGYPLEIKGTMGGDPAEHKASGRGGSWQNEGWDIMVPVGTKALSCCNGTITKVYLGTGALTAGWQISITADDGQQFFYNLHGGSKCFVKEGPVKVGDILGTTGFTNAAHLHWAVNDGWPNRGNIGNKILALAPGSSQFVGSSQPISSPATGSGSDTGDILSTSQATSFAAQLELPGLLESAEALALTGEKSLLNDKPLLPFVQQLTEASFRSFQSLPNGDFYGFYPDYFGEFYHHAPYWMIDDLEVLDGGIDLDDTNLVTHMYVVGDTTFTGNESINNLMSGGVITIFNAFGADIVGDASDGTKKLQKNLIGVNRLLRKDEAVQFLQRYGARPQLEEMPMIKSHLYEMFLAYQKFMLAWSRQFVTPFEFTFMPELYPGGKVGFPDHGLQMYIEEVTHIFDYTNGFVTNANLSAPSALTGSNGTVLNDNLPPNMVEAIIDPIPIGPSASADTPDTKAVE